uniref:Uncharacterized protein n=1 Tax=Arundo donax TaxID=35708 RepID=A0A0A8YN33_ARUDO
MCSSQQMVSLAKEGWSWNSNNKQSSTTSSFATAYLLHKLRNQTSWLINKGTNIG